MSRITKLQKRFPNNKLKTKSPQHSVSAPRPFRAVARSPFAHVAVSLASVMLAGSVHAQTTQLPGVDAEGQSGGGYQATSPSLSRIPTPLRNTPQTVNVVTQQVIQEQRATTMEEALRNVPGITFQAGEGGQQGDSPVIRGFLGRSDMYRDGMRDPGWYTRDLFSTDRVEVYKGPSAFAFGRGATGGAINTVTKLPQAAGVRFLEGTVTGYSQSGLRAEVDAAGSVGNVAGRIAVMGQDVNTASRDHVGAKRFGFAPSIRFDMNERTRATFSYIHQTEDSVPDYGRPYLPQGYYGAGVPTGPVPVPRNVWYGVAGGNLRDQVTTGTNIATAKFERDITNDIKLANTTRWVTVGRMARPTAPRNLMQANHTTAVTPGYPVNLMTIGRQHFQTNTDNTMLVNQTDLNAKFNTGWLEHTLAAGVEVGNETRWQSRANFCTPATLACRTSAFAPVDTNFGGPVGAFSQPTYSNSDTLALYASDQVKVSRWLELLGAVRFDRFATRYQDPANATVANRDVSRTDNLTSWRVGAVVHPTETSSIYVVTGNSFNPSAELATLSSTGATSSALPPEENRTYEAGYKVDLYQGWLSLTGAVFRVEKTNARVPSDGVTAALTVLDGVSRVQGIELGVAGRLTQNWQVSVGYSYLDSKIEKTTVAADLGKEMPGTPPHNLTIWTTYDVTSAWTIGGGAFYQAQAWANNANTNFVPEYVRFDAMASYKVTSNATLQLNLYNLTDVLYYSQYYGGHAVPAAGRSASLSLKMRW